MRALRIAVAAQLCWSAPAAASTVRCYGVDDTAALQAALNAGGLVNVLAGICLLSAGLTEGSNTWFAGAGMAFALVPDPTGGLMPSASGAPSTVLRLMPGVVANVIQVGGGLATNYASNSVLSGFSIDGAATVDSTAPGAWDAVNIPYGQNILVQGNETYDAGNSGIRSFGTTHVGVVGNYVHDNWENGIYGVQGTGAVPQPNVGSYVVGNYCAHNSLFNPPSTTPAVINGVKTPTGDCIDYDTSWAQLLYQGNTVSLDDMLAMDHNKGGRFSTHFTAVDNWAKDGAAPQQQLTGMGGINVNGNLIGFTLLRNHLDTRNYGVIVAGPVTVGMVANNEIIGSTNAALHQTFNNDLDSASSGTGTLTEWASNLVDADTFNQSGSEFYVSGTMNVSVFGNTAPSYNFSGAGPGFFATGNH